MSQKKGILERLAEGVIVGDGGYVWQLERRGYIKAGPWTPEVTTEHPEAVKGLHREFLRAGADVLQALTFYASEDKLDNRGNNAAQRYSVKGVNDAACKIAQEVASEGNALVAAGLSQTPSYMSGASKSVVQSEFKKQIDVFVANNVDFLICELFDTIEEMEWAIEACKVTGKPVAATMCVGPDGDPRGVTPGECAVRMVKAGASIIGLNCAFDPFRTLDVMEMMKEGLEQAGLTAYLMTQPIIFHDPDASYQGFVDLPEFPFALEPRTCTRWDIHKYARRAFELGVRYIGGCCGFEAYHIRAIAEELAAERGTLPVASEKHDPWAASLKMHTKPWIRQRANRTYWENIKPASGRPYSPAMSQPDNWRLIPGSQELKQQKDL